MKTLTLLLVLVTAFALCEPAPPPTPFPELPEVTQVDPAGLALIKKWEGLRLKRYRCPAGVWTIGYGETGSNLHVITKEQAEERVGLRYMLKRTLVRMSVQNLNYARTEALVSFCDNVGMRACLTSTLVKHNNAGRFDLAAAEFGKWINVNSVPTDGLINRRADEKKVYLS